MKSTLKLLTTDKGAGRLSGTALARKDILARPIDSALAMLLSSDLAAHTQPTSAV